MPLPDTPEFSNEALYDAFGREVVRRRNSRITLSEAATLLGVTTATLRQQIANGRLSAWKMGPIWTVAEEEVERYRRESLR